MKYRTLGSTGLRVPEIGFGAWAIGGPFQISGIPIGWGETDDTQSIRAIHKAVDLGVNFFDTADIYGLGHSEELIGRAVRDRRQHVIIATKVGNVCTESRGHRKDFSRSYILQAVDASLTRLQTDVIDVYQLHNPALEVIRQGEVFQTLEDLARAGKIRFYGVSISTPEAGIEIINQGRGHTLQVLYNVLNQKPAETLLPMAQRKNYGVIVRVPLASGLLTGKFTPRTTFPSNDNRRNFLTRRRLVELEGKLSEIRSLLAGFDGSLAQAALAFVLASAAVSVTIPGAKTEEQVLENVRASETVLPDEVLNQLRDRLRGYNFYLRYGVRV